MPAAKKPEETTPAPAVEALTKGEHNPFLQGLLIEGEACNTAIKEWYETRDTLRTQARAAVSTGFASPDQAEAVAKLWPMPKRTKKDGETTEAPEAPEEAKAA